MMLSQLRFDYSIKNNAFTKIGYELITGHKDMPKTEVINIIKESISALDSILAQHYNNKDFDKKEDGQITSSRLTYGYTYTSNNAESIDSMILTNLMCTISEDSTIKLELLNLDTDQARMLSIYDNILAFPNMEFSPDTKAKMDKIEFLRTQKFDIHKYLSR
ncbi:MAG: hypothetical protein ACP5NW_05995 [Candidatus Woesearchaeota archaeon]